MKSFVMKAFAKIEIEFPSFLLQINKGILFK